MGEEDEVEFGLVMPFVVVQPDGPYDSESFVAGCYQGEASMAVKLAPLGIVWKRYVPTALVPQLDLLAMSASVPITTTPWPDHPDEWTLVVLGEAAAE